MACKKCLGAQGNHFEGCPRKSGARPKDGRDWQRGRDIALKGSALPDDISKATLVGYTITQIYRGKLVAILGGFGQVPRHSCD